MQYSSLWSFKGRWEHLLWIIKKNKKPSNTGESIAGGRNNEGDKAYTSGVNEELNIPNTT